MTKHFMLKAINLGIKNILSLDPESQQRLAKLEKHTAKVHIENIDFTFYIYFNEHGCMLTEEPQDSVDITLSGTTSALFKYGIERQQTSLYKSNVKITGDMGLGEELQNIFKQIDIDWEAGIAKYTGDIIANKITRLASSGIKWRKQLQENLRTSSKEYLQDEIKLLPKAKEVEHFSAKVNQLRSDIERLSNTIGQLEATMK